MIYMIQSNDLVKIGHTNNVSRRLFELQTGNPYKLNLIFMGTGGADEEKELHKAYSKYRANGEWFKIEGEFKRIFDFIKKSTFSRLGLQYGDLLPNGTMVFHEAEEFDFISWENSKSWLMQSANDLWGAIETCWAWDGWGEKYCTMARPIQDKLDSIRDEENLPQDMINAWQVFFECENEFGMIQQTVEQELDEVW